MKFNKFKGISEEREIIEREKTSLDYLLGSCDEIIKKYTAIDTETNEQINEKYIKICNSLKEELPEFSEQDLAGLVFAKANNEYAEKESRVLGLYTGVLLHLLTERNAKQGKGTKFCINGHGSRFDYLFYFAKKIDELIISSFTGDRICEFVASYDGRANKIMLNNNKGVDAARYAGRYRGSINVLIINNNRGYGAAFSAGSDNGGINALIISNNKGDDAAWYAGGDKGSINALVINNNQGYRVAGNAGSYRGNINALIIHNNKGDCVADGAGYCNGRINKIILNNVRGENTVISAKAKQIISGEKAIAEYQRLSPECKLDDVFKLLDSFKDKTPEEIIAAAEQIEAYLKK